MLIVVIVATWPRGYTFYYQQGFNCGTKCDSKVIHLSERGKKSCDLHKATNWIVSPCRLFWLLLSRFSSRESWKDLNHPVTIWSRLMVELAAAPRQFVAVRLATVKEMIQMINLHGSTALEHSWSCLSVHVQIKSLDKSPPLVRFVSDYLCPTKDTWPLWCCSGVSGYLLFSVWCCLVHGEEGSNALMFMSPKAEFWTWSQICKTVTILHTYYQLWELCAVYLYITTS